MPARKGRSPKSRRARAPRVQRLSREHYPRATFAVLDRAGHALPHEQVGLLTALMGEWLDRVREGDLR